MHHSVNDSHSHISLASDYPPPPPPPPPFFQGCLGTRLTKLPYRTNFPRSRIFVLFFVDRSWTVEDMHCQNIPTQRFDVMYACENQKVYTLPLYSYFGRVNTDPRDPLSRVYHHRSYLQKLRLLFQRSDKETRGEVHKAHATR